MKSDYLRPDPDVLLNTIKEKEEKVKKGRLKIFFGMAAGVGKTYAMLEAAHALKKEGIDIVIGYVETHGRSETNILVEGLEIVPRKNIELNGMNIGEFDLDCVLMRRPSVVLVDELAHSNVSGSRHSKRCQDIVELLENGISVFSTLNVQHLESQKDLVEKITGVKIRETVPDTIVDMAEEIVLIDIPPEGLLKRLSEGKVYHPERAEIAAEKFFRKGNITALRELSLRYVARIMDSEVNDYLLEKKISGPWKTSERLLVAVSPSPYSSYLIRWTSRMALNLKAPWIALYVKSRKPLNDTAEKNLEKNLNLARELGAEVISTPDEDIVSGLMRVASQKNITQIIAGKPLRRYLADYVTGGNLVEKLLKVSGDIEIHVVTQPFVEKRRWEYFNNFSKISNFKDYAFSFFYTLAVTFFGKLIVQFTGYWTIALIYLMWVSVSALFMGRGPVLFAAALSAMLWNYLFIPPLYTIMIDKLEDAVMFGSFFVIATILGIMTSRMRYKDWALEIREKNITDLYEFSRSMKETLNFDETVKNAIGFIDRYFAAKSAIILADESGMIKTYGYPGSTLEVSEKMMRIAEWAFGNRKPAGLFTDTLSSAESHFVPLILPGKTVGVLAICPEEGKVFSVDERDFLQNISYQLALRVEQEQVMKSEHKNLLLRESEKLHNILLNSISHELRTPLTTITGASSSLLDVAVDRQPEIRKHLYEEIKKASDRMNRLVENLLNMSRLESGMLKVNMQLHDIQDLFGVVLRKIGSDLGQRKVIANFEAGLPMVMMDRLLMEQVLTNLLYNAVIHTPESTTIRMEAFTIPGFFKLKISDNGDGLLTNEMPYIFEKFRRGAKTTSGGTGLGLSICKSIVEMHGGYIYAGNQPEGGAVFKVELPFSIGKEGTQ